MNFKTLSKFLVKHKEFSGEMLPQISQKSSLKWLAIMKGFMEDWETMKV